MSDNRQYFFISESRPRESSAQRLIRFNFWLSVALFVVMVVWSYVLLARTGRQVAPIGLAGNAATGGDTNIGGGVDALMEVVAGWLFYRRGGNAARGAAAFVGLYLLAALLVLVGSVAPGESPNTLVTVVVIYAIGSHFLYAAAGSSQRRF